MQFGLKGLAGPDARDVKPERVTDGIGEKESVIDSVIDEEDDTELDRVVGRVDDMKLDCMFGVGDDRTVELGCVDGRDDDTAVALEYREVTAVIPAARVIMMGRSMECMVGEEYELM
ncbi:hypothetical protein OQA88_8536 [Cercophora sp. LCS_1]